jgi:hypothetical protein
MKAIAIYPGKSNSGQLAEMPRPSIREILSRRTNKVCCEVAEM